MSPKTNISFIASICGAILLLSPAFASAQSVVAPTLTLTLSNSSMTAVANPSYNSLPTISWSSANATSCNAFGTGWSGSVPLAGNQKVNPSNTTVYIMTCTSAGGTTIKSVTLTVTKSTTQSASVIDGYNQITNGTSDGQTQSGLKYTWTRTLEVGSTYTSDVSALQTALTLEGVYSSEITGGFYSKTLAAVKLFQAKYSIEAIGIVGPMTRAKLNQLYGN